MIIKPSPHLLLSLITGLLVTASGVAQAQDDLRFLSGVTFYNPANKKHYAYLRWRSENPEHLRGQAAAAFVKSGPPAGPGVFASAATLVLQKNPQAIDTLINAFPRRYFDPDAFEDIIDGMFGEMMPAVTLTLGEKVAFLTHAAEGDADVYSRLMVFAYAHPVMAVCLGSATVVQMPSNQATFELRAQPNAGNLLGVAFSEVIGRVTLNVNQPVALPAPPAPQHLPDLTPTGHLNAKLRWDDNDALRRVTPVTFGYDLYRINRAFAEARGFPSSPPSPSALATLLKNSPTQVKLVNSGAILPAEGGPDTAFYADDNGAALGQGLPFQDGQQVYYFVAVRDLLGQPGPLSSGTLVTFCNRMPPESPRRVKVENVRLRLLPSSPPTTRLKVTWEAHSSVLSNVQAGYRVYRWESVNELHSTTDPALIATHLVSPSIPHVPGQTGYEWVDTSPIAPTPTDDTGRTVWYTVKAVQNSACGLLESGDSAPGWGVIRDFSGPEGGFAAILLSNSRLEIDLTALANSSLTPELNALFRGREGNVSLLRIGAVRDDPAIRGIAWGITRKRPNGEDQYVTLRSGVFPNGTNALDFYQRLPITYFQDPAVHIWFRTIDIAGRSTYLRSPIVDYAADHPMIKNVRVDLSIERETETVMRGSPNPGWVHQPVAPGVAGVIPLEIFATVPEDAREYKLYKRYNGGPRLLVKQKAGVSAPGNVEEIQDTSFPPYGGEVCYFIQWFDQHGNPSPLAELGCLTLAAKNPMPVPVLETPRTTGTLAAPTVTLRWFCPPEGVERFRVYIGDGATPLSGAPPPTTYTITGATIRGKTLGGSVIPSVEVVIPPALRNGVSFTSIETGRVGADFGNSATPSQFEITLDCPLGRTLHYFVESVSAADDTSSPSNTVPFDWTPSAPLGPAQVPWPARSLPPIDPGFLPLISAQVVDDESRFVGGGIRIGNFLLSSGAIDYGGPRFQLDVPSSPNPTSFPNHPNNEVRLFTTAQGESVMPCVLYRYQVNPNTGQAVTGDIIQCSPLIEDLLLKIEGSDVKLYNPFIDIFADGSSHGVFIKDNQPVVAGATYQYLLVRFKDDGEIDRVLQPNTVTFPQ